MSNAEMVRDLGMRLMEDAQDAQNYMDKAEQEFAELTSVLWEIYKVSGADTDGDTGPGALIAGMGLIGFAKVVLEEVRELRETYDEEK